MKILNSLSFRVRALLVFAAGAVMALSMPPTAWWPLLFFGLSFFYILLSPIKGWRAFFLGWLFGLGYFLVGLYWIGNALLVPGNTFLWVWPLAVLGLPVGLAIFTGAGCWLAARLADLKTWRGYAALIVCLIFVEWLRGHIFTGFPWNLYGYGWAGHLPMVQSVSLFGVYGLTLLTIAWCTLPGFLLASGQSRKVVSFSTIVLLLSLGCFYGWGWNRLNTNPPQSRDDVIVRVVQPNIPQDEKWDRELQVQNLQKIVRQSSADFISGKTYAVIWPETAISDYVAKDKNAADFIRDSIFLPGRHGFLISGVLRHEEDPDGKPRYSNSLVAYDTNLTPVATYNKSHLVPFGEYIPFQKFIPLKPVVQFSGFTPGDGIETQLVSGLPSFSGLVCYEVLFPGFVAEKTPRPEWIINVTNDSWYGDSPGPYQHLTKAVYRAVEEGLPLARAANTGVSAFIDSYGRIESKIGYNKTGYIDVALAKPALNATLYTQHKDLFVLMTGLALLIFIFRRTRI
jgi:apolipoprotein N-acyltransferase